jgi:hypothetical protein
VHLRDGWWALLSPCLSIVIICILSSICVGSGVRQCGVLCLRHHVTHNVHLCTCLRVTPPRCVLLLPALSLVKEIRSTTVFNKPISASLCLQKISLPYDIIATLNPTAFRAADHDAVPIPATGPYQARDQAPRNSSQRPQAGQTSTSVPNLSR